MVFLVPADQKNRRTVHPLVPVPDLAGLAVLVPAVLDDQVLPGLRVEERRQVGGRGFGRRGFRGRRPPGLGQLGGEGLSQAGRDVHAERRENEEDDGHQGGDRLGVGQDDALRRDDLDGRLVAGERGEELRPNLLGELHADVQAGRGTPIGHGDLEPQQPSAAADIHVVVGLSAGIQPQDPGGIVVLLNARLLPQVEGRERARAFAGHAGFVGGDRRGGVVREMIELDFE